MKNLPFLLLLLFGLLPGKSQALDSLAGYWNCPSATRISGSWNYGVAPVGCQIPSSLVDPNFIVKRYGPLFFDLRNSTTKEREKYMNSLHATLRNAAENFFTKRKPSASSTEKQAFVRAVFTMALMESFWTHYRFNTSGNPRTMRGDSGAGHGMMQLDYRSHDANIRKGYGIKFVEHVMTSWDQFYRNWQKVATGGASACVTNLKDYASYARSSYSAYNGGGAKICRWKTGTVARWRAVDDRFYSNYQNRTWEKYITNPTKADPINFPCLAEGNETCPVVGEDGGNDEAETLEELLLVNDSSKIFQAKSGNYCALKDGKFHCITDVRDLACLKAVSPVVFEDSGNSLVPVLVKAQDLSAELGALSNSAPQVVYDRHVLCPKATSSLRVPSRFIRPNLNINLRETANGTLSGTSVKGQAYQVLDYELQFSADEANQIKRYYYIQVGTKRGYIYAGEEGVDLSKWTTAIVPVFSAAIIPYLEGKVVINTTNGTKVRNSIGGTQVGVAKAKAQYEITGVHFKLNENELYLKIKYDGALEGYIYGGRLRPDFTFANWVGPVK